MGILTWIILGLIVGIIAKFIMPGKDPGGIFITIVLGVAGAFVGGLSVQLWDSGVLPDLISEVCFWQWGGYRASCYLPCH